MSKWAKVLRWSQSPEAKRLSDRAPYIIWDFIQYDSHQCLVDIKKRRQSFEDVLLVLSRCMNRFGLKREIEDFRNCLLTNRKRLGV